MTQSVEMCVYVSQSILRKQYLEITWKQTFEEHGQKEEPQPSSDLSEPPVVVEFMVSEIGNV